MSGQIEGLVGLAKELKRLGHTTELVTAFGDALLNNDRLVLAERDDALLVGKVRRIGSILVNLVRRAKFVDIIHLNLPTPAFAILGDIVQQLVDTPVVVGFEAHLAETSQPLQLPGIWNSPGFYLPRLLVNNNLTARCTWHRTSRYIVSSQHQAKELHRLGFPPARISVLPTVIDIDKLQPLDRINARRQLNLPEGQLIAYVGHYHHVKGVDVLIEAFGRVVRDRPDCHLVLAWSGLGDPRPIARAAKELGVDDHVIQLGRVPIGTIISAVDVLALPYRYTMGQNAYPALMLEAMALGVPMVTSDLPLLEELLEHERTALLVLPNDASALAWGISRLVENKTLAKEMAAKQRRLVAERLNPEEIAKQYVRIYQQVCTGETAVLQSSRREQELRPTAFRRTKRGVGKPQGTEYCDAIAAVPREDP